MGADRKYCMCCGEEVPVNVVDRHGQVELTCMHCGFTLDVVAPEEAALRPASCIMTVDDAPLSRDLLRDLLLESRLAEEVLALPGGPAFVTAVAQRFAEGLPVDLVVLDIEMPAMDGFTVARFLRSLEARVKHRPCPIVFFSARKADENLRRQMALYHPAWYFAKGAGEGAEKLRRRVASLVRHITRLVAEPAAPPAASAPPRPAP